MIPAPSIHCLTGCTESQTVQALFNGSNDAVVFTDPARRVIWCNPAFERLLGFALADLKGRTLEHFYLQNSDFFAAERHLLDSLTGSSGDSYPMTYLHRAGIAIETETTAWTFPADDGSLGGHVKILRDRTDANRIARIRHRMISIATDQSATGSERINDLLALACETLLMPIGTVSLLRDGMLTVAQARSTLTQLLVGSTYAAEDTDCAMALQMDGLYERHDITGGRSHPLLRGMPVLSHVGVPLMLGRKVAGVLSLLNPLPRAPLSVAERDVLADIARFIANQMAQDHRERALERAATEDWLTGAGTNRQFRRDLEVVFNTVRRNDATASLILLDIDHFKAINDNYGHDMGDRVLAEIAGRVQASLAPRLRLYRVGGEEFAIILPGTAADSAALQAERIRQNLAEGLQDWDGMPQVTASFGVAGLDGDITEPEAWVKCADIALYASKNAGRNRVTSNGEIAGVELPAGWVPTSSGKRAALLTVSRT